MISHKQGAKQPSDSRKSVLRTSWACSGSKVGNGVGVTGWVGVRVGVEVEGMIVFVGRGDFVLVVVRRTGEGVFSGLFCVVVNLVLQPESVTVATNRR